MEHQGWAHLSSHSFENAGLWWDAPVGAYAMLKERLLACYPLARHRIEQLMPGSRPACSLLSVRTVTRQVLDNPAHWERRAEQWTRLMCNRPMNQTLYDWAVRDSAELLFDIWLHSDAAQGWLAVEIEPDEMYSVARMLRRGRELANLMPNVMVSVPVSDMGCEVIEELVATGHAVHLNQVSSLSQAQAGLRAVKRGRERAVLDGVELKRTRHILSFRLGQFSTQGATFRPQEVGTRWTAQESRWADIALGRAFSHLLQASGLPVQLLLGGLAQGEERLPSSSWHGERAVLHARYALEDAQVEQLIVAAVSQAMRPLPPMAQNPCTVPAPVRGRLLRSQAFRRAWFADALAPEAFARQPAFERAVAERRKAYDELQAFARHLANPSFGGLVASMSMADAGGRVPDAK